MWNERSCACIPLPERQGN
ncbi:MAG: hypothetical protein E7316_04680 [Clostridiales bacterium]|nr:hypothetical protein [Clostridiales bacterium]